jgi:hypothetical protein
MAEQSETLEARVSDIRSTLTSIKTFYEETGVGESEKAIESIKVEIQSLLKQIETRVEQADNLVSAQKESEYLALISSRLEKSRQTKKIDTPINHDYNFRDSSEGAALSMFEFPLHIEDLKGRLGVKWSTLGITVKETDMHLTGEQWFKRIAHNKYNLVVLSYILSLSDATYRKNIDAVKIMSAVANGILASEPGLESAWSDVAAKAYSGEDFEEWRKNRSINIIKHFTDGDPSTQNFTIKKGTFESLLATLPLFRFDAVHGMKSGNKKALMGAYANNANGIADIMCIQINESGIMENQVNAIGNIPDSIIAAYEASYIGLALK